MSRVIENDHRWSEDEIAYQLRRGRHSEVEKNQKQFPPGSEKQVELELSPEVFEFVNGLDEDGLTEELKLRKLSTGGSEVDMKVRLAQAIQKEVDADDSSD